ncbi:MAG: hypothetical protein AAGK09_12410 [Planctomycetota bacterium]
MSAGVRSWRVRAGRPRPVQWVSLLTSLWLLGSWAVVLLRDSPEPAARWMVGSIAVWLWLIWPVWRLSSVSGGEPGLRVKGLAATVLMEWACVALVLQAALWPLRVVGDWGTGLTMWVDLWLLGWGLWGAAWVAWTGVAARAAAGSWRWAGTIATGGWLAVMFGGGAVLGVTGMTPPIVANPWGGLGVAIGLGRGEPGVAVPAELWSAAGAVGLSGLLAWAGAALAARRVEGSREPATTA